MKTLFDNEDESYGNDLLEENPKRANGPNDSLRGVFVRLGKRPLPSHAVQRISSRPKTAPSTPIDRYISWNYLRQHLMKRNQGYHTLSSVRL
jgi:hypothetical protein